MTDLQTGWEWRSRAACLAEDPELFFPVAESGAVLQVQVAAAKAVCARCPVRQACLVEALARIPVGIAGGLTAHERRGLHRGPVGASVDAVVVESEPGADRARVAEAGRRLLAAGVPARAVAARCGVSERTVTRWAARTRTSTHSGSSRGCGGVA
jgi:Transcription factor WhiB/Homeodomain-like domain